MSLKSLLSFSAVGGSLGCSHCYGKCLSFVFKFGNWHLCNKDAIVLFIRTHTHTNTLTHISFFGIESCYVAQAGPKLLDSSHPPALASQSAGITGMSHRTWPALILSLTEILENRAAFPLSTVLGPQLVLHLTSSLIFPSSDWLQFW